MLPGVPFNRNSSQKLGNFNDFTLESDIQDRKGVILQTFSLLQFLTIDNIPNSAFAGEEKQFHGTFF